MLRTGNLTARVRLPLSWFQPVGQTPQLRLQVNPALSVLRQLAQDRHGPTHSQWYRTLDHHSAFHRNRGTANGFDLTYGVGAGTAVTAPALRAFTLSRPARAKTAAAVRSHNSAQVRSCFDGISADVGRRRLWWQRWEFEFALRVTPSQQPLGRHYSFSLLRRTTAAGCRIAADGNCRQHQRRKPAVRRLSNPRVTTNAGSSNSWVCSGNDCYFMYAFRATATGTSGTVTVTFPTTVKNAAVDVIALSGNDTANPIGPDRNQLAVTAARQIGYLSRSFDSRQLDAAIWRHNKLYGHTSHMVHHPPSRIYSRLTAFPRLTGREVTVAVNYFGGPSACL